MKDMGAEIQHTKMSTKKHQGYEGGRERMRGTKRKHEIKICTHQGRNKKIKEGKNKREGEGRWWFDNRAPPKASVLRSAQVAFRNGSGNGYGAGSTGETRGRGVGSSCGSCSCSCCGSCSGYDCGSGTFHSWDCEGHPPSPAHMQFHPGDTRTN